MAFDDFHDDELTKTFTVDQDNPDDEAIKPGPAEHDEQLRQELMRNPGVRHMLNVIATHERNAAFEVVMDLSFSEREQDAARGKFEAWTRIRDLTQYL